MIKINDFLKHKLDYPSLTICVAAILLLFKTANTTFALYDLIKNIIVVIAIVWLIFNFKSIYKEFYFVAFIAYILIWVLSTNKYIDSYDYFKSIFLDELLYTSLIFIALLAPIKNKKAKEKTLFILKIVLVIGIIFVDIVSKNKVADSAAGLTNHYNTLGGINFFAIIVVMSLIFNNKLYFTAILIPYFVYTILFTSSRAAALWAVIAIFVLATYSILKNVKNKWIKSFVILLYFLVAIAAAVVLKPKITEYMTRFAIDDSTTYNFLNTLSSGRLRIWFTAFPATIKDNVLFGQGMVTKDIIDAQKQLFLTYSSDEAMFMHNIFLDIIYGVGIVGFVYFLSFIFAGIKKAKGNKNFTINLMLIILMILYFTLDTCFIWYNVGTFCFYMLFADFINGVKNE